MKKLIKTAGAVLVAAMLVTAAAAEDIKGEVKKIDESAGKMTLKHGPIKNLGMEDESMTMVFRVADPSMLKDVKVGDKVQFEAERQASGITITKLQKAK